MLTGCTSIIVYLLPEAAVMTIFVENPATLHSLVRMTLEDISVFFGDQVQSSFEQALNREAAGKGKIKIKHIEVDENTAAT